MLITGASYGIGACLAETLAPTGARLLLAARTREQLLEVQRRVAARGGRAEVLPCDLADAADVQALIAQLRQRPDGVDLVVSNADKRPPWSASLTRSSASG